MNEFEMAAVPSEQRQIDLLVDGELSERACRELLVLCDRRPELWRRCALAFVEAQAWRREFQALAQRPPADASAPSRHAANVVAVPARSLVHSRRTLPFGGMMALAASLLVAFGAGWFARPVVSRPLGAELSVAAVNPSADSPASRAVVPEGASDAGSQVAADRWETVTLVLGAGPDGEERSIELPIRDDPADDATWLSADQPTVPAELVEVFRRLGHQVQQRRHFVPLHLEDGRQAIVPVDDFELTPLSNHNFQ